MKLTRLFAASLVGSASLSAWAVDPQSMYLGGFKFTPTLQVSEWYDDNYRAMHDNAPSSWVTSISPTFLLSAETRNSGYQLEYSFNTETYHSDAEASNVDHHLIFRSIQEFNARNRLKWNLQYHRVEDTADSDTEYNEDFGQNLSSSSNYNEENDKYSRALAGATYTYGVESGMNQIDVGANYEARRYYNSGDLNKDQEYDSVMFNTVWYHRLGAKTRSLLELRHTTFDYKLSTSERDSTNYAVLGGLTWNATAKTTGTVKLGAQRKNFDSNERTDYTSPMWEAGVTYSPRTYSHFDLNSRRAFDEGDDGASTIETVTTRLGWTHEWSAFIKTELEGTYADREYKATEREDKRKGYGASVTYSPDRWLDFTLGYRRVDNDSNVTRESYLRNIYQLSVEMSL